MHIKILHDKINKQREQKGLSPLSEVEFTAQISVLQLNGKIKVENGEVKSTQEKGD
jgi:hypothetical protein